MGWYSKSDIFLILDTPPYAFFLPAYALEQENF